MPKNGKEIYPLNLEVNGYHFSEVVISHHYQQKHSDITDELILEILKLFVDKNTFRPDKLTTDYFVLEKILHQGKKYKLICQIEDENSFIVVNCYRIKKK
jgi:hypothetical protein